MKQKIILPIFFLMIFSLSVFVSAQTCTDSDNGKDYYTKGTFSGLWQGQQITNTDSCVDALDETGDDVTSSNYLGEGYCENNQLKVERITCPNGCSDGICLKVEPSEETGPIDLPENIPEEAIKILCNGCELEGKCYPFNYRKDKNYCSIDQEFVPQLESGFSCENNFECDSNLCINDECVSGSLWAKFIRWLSRIFG